MKPGRIATISLVLSGLAVILLLVSVVQLDALEERAATQSRQLSVLGESTEKLAGQLRRLESGGIARGDARGGEECEIDPILHPEVENFLKPRGIEWPPKGASLTGTYKKGWDRGDPKGFNWMVQSDAYLQYDIAQYVDLNVAWRNIWTNPDEWHGQAACRVEITDDYKTYTIYIRKGLYWHAPSGVDLKDPRYAWLDKKHELTADDYIFTYELMKNPQVENNNLRNYFEDLEGVEAVAPHTFVVRWKKKTYQSLDATLSMAWALPKFLFAYTEDGRPIPKETLGLRFNQHWYNNKGYVGVGPYRMVEYKPGSHIKLTRNEEFHGDRPAIKDVIYPIYTDRTLSVLKLKSGELNFVELRPGQYREEYLEWQKKPKAAWPKNNPFLNGQINCETVTYPGFRYIGWNIEKPLFQDRRVRNALSHAFNTKQIVDKVWLGLGVPTSGPFAPGSPRYDSSIDPLAFDLSRSKALLSEAGWSDTDGDGLIDKVINGKRTPFEFTFLSVANFPEVTAMANIFKEDLLKVGIKMNIAAVEWSLLMKRMDEKNFDAYAAAWTANWDGDPYQIFHSSQADAPKGSNKVGFRNKQADKLMETLRVTFEPQERQRLYRQLHRVLHEEQPYTFFSFVKRVYCWRSELKNVMFTKDFPVEDMRPWWVASAQ